jgi:hypothetical protein
VSYFYQYMNRSVIISLLALHSWIAVVLAGNLDGNYYADINNDLFITPKSSAMAGSDVSLSRNAQPLGNPANLPSDSINRIELAYAGYYQNAFSTSALSYVGSIDPKSSFGVSMSYLWVPEIQEYIDSTTPGPISSASQFFFRAGYGRLLYRIRNAIELSGGAAINGQRINLIDKNGYGIGLDAGATVRFINSGLTASLMIENITTSYTRWSGQYSEFAYPHARLGIGWQREFEYIYGRLSVAYLSPDLFSNEGLNTFAVDSMPTDDGSGNESAVYVIPDRERVSRNPAVAIFGKYGAEYVIMNRLAFRAGLNLATLNFTFGAGLGLLDNCAGIDFAYCTHELAPTYKLSVNYKWF